MGHESPPLLGGAAPIVPEVVLWDLGGVVYDVDLEAARRAWRAHTGRSGDELDERLFESGLKDAMDRGSVSPAEVRGALGLDDATWRALWNGVLCLRAPVDELIRAATAGRTRAGVLSNTDPVHAEFIRSTAPFAARIERWVLSFEVHAMKPEPAIYEAALAAFAGVGAERVLFLDDRPENVAGARALGMDAVRCCSFEDARAALAERGLRP
jgi:FMN phosphatase YigB (HAD superfamily)